MQIDKSMVGRLVRCKCAYKTRGGWGWHGIREGEIYRVGKVTKDGRLLLQTVSESGQLVFAAPNGYDPIRFDILDSAKILEFIFEERHYILKDFED